MTCLAEFCLDDPNQLIPIYFSCPNCQNKTKWGTFIRLLKNQNCYERDDPEDNPFIGSNRINEWGFHVFLFRNLRQFESANTGKITGNWHRIAIEYIIYFPGEFQNLFPRKFSNSKILVLGNQFWNLLVILYTINRILVGFKTVSTKTKFLNLKVSCFSGISFEIHHSSIVQCLNIHVFVQPTGEIHRSNRGKFWTG